MYKIDSESNINKWIIVFQKNEHSDFAKGNYFLLYCIDIPAEYRIVRYDVFNRIVIKQNWIILYITV